MSHTYRHAMKATAVLSGAQVVEALMSIIRAKIIALILGPVGIALNSIFQTTITTIYQFASLGLSQSAVRDISRAWQGNDKSKLFRIIKVFRKIMLPLAIFSMCFCIILAPLLSKLSFGNSDNHTIDFIILSIGSAAILLSYANITILQGTQKLLYLAKTTIFGAILGLLFSLPFYFLLGNKGIAWAVSLGYVVTYIINSFYIKKLNIPSNININWQEALKVASPMIKLGIVIMISTIIINLFTYFTNVLIRYFGSLNDVGLYQAGYSLTSRNFAILSAALVADYYPRLAGLTNNQVEFNKTVSEQGEILLLVISYVSMLLIIFSDLIIRILLSKDFLVISTLVKFIAFSFVFHVMWITLSYIALAKGDKKIYLTFDAIIGNGGYFLLNISFYYFWGLTGIAVSTVIGSIFVSVLLLTVYGKKYKFKYSSSFWKVQLTSIFFVSAFMLFQLIENKTFVYYPITIITAIIFTIYTYKALDKRLDIKTLLKNKLRK